MKKIISKLLILLTTSIILISTSYADFYPDGGEIFIVNKQYSIQWDKHYFGNDDVLISLWMYKESRWKDIGFSNASLGSMKWLVPSVQGDQYRIKVQSKQNPSKIMLSTTFFSIKTESNNGGGGQSFEQSSTLEIQCAPAPTEISANCMWSDGEAVAISVYTLSGVRLYHQPLLASTSHTIDCRTWTSGTYIVEVILSDGKHKIGKFVKIY